MKNKTIGIIGFGKMAEGLVRGFLDAKSIRPEQILFSGRSEARIEQVKRRYLVHHASVEDLVEASDLIFVCIKPQQLPTIQLLLNKPSLTWENKTIISILAGIPISRFQGYVDKGAAIFRVMPNSPVQVRKGYSALCYSSNATQETIRDVTQLMESVGTAVEVQEKQMDIATSLSGSGPAFFYRIANQMIKIGESQGLSNQQAYQLVVQTIKGAAEMMEQTNESLETLIQSVASPGGTTEAGLNEMDKRDIDTHIQEVIKAAAHRSSVLAKEINNA